MIIINQISDGILLTETTLHFGSKKKRNKEIKKKSKSENFKQRRYNGNQVYWDAVYGCIKTFSIYIKYELILKIWPQYRWYVNNDLILLWLKCYWQKNEVYSAYSKAD